MSANLSPAQFRARMKLCREATENGWCVSQTAVSLNITTAALSKWLKSHNGAFHKILASTGRAKPKQQLGKERTIQRLRNVINLGQRGAARAEGVSDQAISQWLLAVAPDGAELALLDFIPETQ